MDKLLFGLLEEYGVSEEEISYLRESAKEEGLRDLLSTVIDNVKSKMNFDTFLIDRSRGDIKLYRDLEGIQEAISRLEVFISSSVTKVPDKATYYLNRVCKAILYINQYATEFKIAYKDKKTIMILKYQSLIAAIIYTVSYLISALFEVSIDGIKLKENAVIEDITPFKTIEDFCKQVESGELKKYLSDVNTLREMFDEFSGKNIGLTEAGDMISVIKDGIESIYANLDQGGRLSGLVYKLLGVVTFILSLREIVYTLFRSRTRFSDVLDTVKTFGSQTDGGSLLAKVGSFASKFKSDAENASYMANRDIDNENRALLTGVKSLDTVTLPSNTPQPSTLDSLMEF